MPNKRISCDISKLMNGTQPWIEHNSVVAALLAIEHHLDPVWWRRKKKNYENFETEN